MPASSIASWTGEFDKGRNIHPWIPLNHESRSQIDMVHVIRLYRRCGNRKIGCSHGEILTKANETELYELLVIGGN